MLYWNSGVARSLYGVLHASFQFILLGDQTTDIVY